MPSNASVYDMNFPYMLGAHTNNFIEIQKQMPQKCASIPYEERLRAFLTQHAVRIAGEPLALRAIARMRARTCKVASLTCDFMLTVDYAAYDFSHALPRKSDQLSSGCSRTVSTSGPSGSELEKTPNWELGLSTDVSIAVEGPCAFSLFRLDEARRWKRSGDGAST